MKRILSVLLCCAILLNCLPLGADSTDIPSGSDTLETIQDGIETPPSPASSSSDTNVTPGDGDSNVTPDDGGSNVTPDDDNNNITPGDDESTIAPDASNTAPDDEIAEEEDIDEEAAKAQEEKNKLLAQLQLLQEQAEALLQSGSGSSNPAIRYLALEYEDQISFDNFADQSESILSQLEPEDYAEITLITRSTDASAYCFHSSHQENGWLIQGGSESAPCYLVPGKDPSTSPYTSEAIPVDIGWNFSLKNSDDYLTFGTGNTPQFGNSTNEEEAAQIFFFQKSDDGYPYGTIAGTQALYELSLAGYSVLDDPSQLDDSPYLIGAVLYSPYDHAWFYLIDPAGGNPILVKELKYYGGAEASVLYSAPASASTYEVEWEKSIELTDILFPKHISSDTKNGNKNTRMIPSESDTIAEMEFNDLTLMQYGSNAYNGTSINFESCYFQFVSQENDQYQVKSGSYYIAIDQKKGEYRTISGSQYSYRYGFPTSKDGSADGSAETIKVSCVGNGNFQFQGISNSKLGYISAWGVFAPEGTHEKVDGYDFSLFEVRNEQFVRIQTMDEIKPESKYLIGAYLNNNKATWLMIRPASDEPSQDPSNCGAGMGHSTVTIKGLNPGSADLLTGRMIVTVTNPYDLSTLAPMITGIDSGSQSFYTIVGGELRVTMGGEIKPADIISRVNPGVASMEILGFSPQMLYGKAWKNGSYSDPSVVLDDCLYTYQDRKFSHTSSNGTVYLTTAHGAVNQSNPESFEVACANGYFTLTSQNQAEGGVNNILAFSGWGVFTNQNFAGNPSNLKKNDIVTKLLVYQKSSGSGCAELPGFQRVTGDLSSGAEYLIAVVYKGNMYILRPEFDSSGGYNGHLLMRSEHYSATTEIAFNGLSLGQDDQAAQYVIYDNHSNKNVTLTVNVLNNDPHSECIDHFYSMTGAAAGYPLCSLAISSGMEYKLELRPNGARASQDGIVWFSSNKVFVSVDQDGTLHTHDPSFVSNQQVWMVDIYAYEISADTLHKLTLTILKNGYGNDSADINILDHYFEFMDNTSVYRYFPIYGNPNFIESNFQQVRAHDATYLYRDNNQPWAMNYFVRPDDGYALTYVQAFNSQNQFFKLDDADPRSTNYFSSSPVNTQKTLYTTDSVSGEQVMADMIQYALDKDCTAALGFTKSAGNFDRPPCVLGFRSQPVVTVEKTVAYVFPHSEISSVYDNFKTDLSDHGGVPSAENWTEYQYKTDYVAKQNDVVVFKIHVVGPPDGVSSDIAYSSMELIEELKDAQFLYVTQVQYGTQERNSLEIVDYYTENGLTDYYVGYTIKDVDESHYLVGLTLTNSVSLVTRYSTDFQGLKNLESTSTATASLKMVISNHIEYVNLTLDTGVAANVYIKSTTQTDNWHTDHPTADYYVAMEVSYGTEAGRIIVNTVRQSFQRDAVEAYVSSNSENQKYYRFSVPLAVEDLGSDVTVYLENSKGERITEGWTFQPKVHAEKLLEAEQTALIQSWWTTGGKTYAIQQKEALNTLLKALLNFAAATQKYLHHNDANPANSVLDNGDQTIEPITSIAGPNTAPPKDIGSNEWYSISGAQNGITFQGLALELSTQNTGIRVYFTSSPALDLQKIHGVNSTIVNQDSHLYQFDSEANIYQDSSGMYYVRLGNISPKMLGNKYTVSISRFDGSAYGDPASVTFSSMTYAYLLSREHQPGTPDTNLERMIAAMYQYQMAAQDFFGNNDNLTIETRARGGQQ